MQLRKWDVKLIWQIHCLDPPPCPFETKSIYVHAIKDGFDNLKFSKSNFETKSFYVHVKIGFNNFSNFETKSIYVHVKRDGVW